MAVHVTLYLPDAEAALLRGYAERQGCTATEAVCLLLRADGRWGDVFAPVRGFRAQGPGTARP